MQDHMREPLLQHLKTCQSTAKTPVVRVLLGQGQITINTSIEPDFEIWPRLHGYPRKAHRGLNPHTPLWCCRPNILKRATDHTATSAGVSSAYFCLRRLPTAQQGL